MKVQMLLLLCRLFLANPKSRQKNNPLKNRQKDANRKKRKILAISYNRNHTTVRGGKYQRFTPEIGISFPWFSLAHGHKYRAHIDDRTDDRYGEQRSGVSKCLHIKRYNGGSELQ